MENPSIQDLKSSQNNTIYNRLNLQKFGVKPSEIFLLADHLEAASRSAKLQVVEPHQAAPVDF